MSTPILKKGYLVKQGGVNSSISVLKTLSGLSWKRRFFEYNGVKLVYYKSDSDREKLGEFDLSNDFVVTEKNKDKDNGFEIIADGNSYLLAAESKQDLIDWMQILKAYSKKDARPSQDQDDEMSDGEVDFQEDMEAIIQTCILKGKLDKLGSKLTKFKNWKKRWFILSGKKIYYLKNLEDPKPLGILDLSQCLEVKIADEEVGSLNSFAICILGRTYYCRAENPQEQEEWMNAILVVKNNIQRGSSSPSIPVGDKIKDLQTSTNQRNSGSPRLSTIVNLSLDSKNESDLNEYLRLMKSFDADDDIDDDIDEDVDDDLDDGEMEDEADTKQNIANQTKSENPEQTKPLMDESTKNLINTLFRLNSMASKIMKFYGKLIGSGYLIDVLKPIIVELAESNKSMEVDPLKIKEGENAEENKKYLVQVCQQILTAIFESRKHVPWEIAAICKHLYLEVEKHYPGNGPKQLGGFLFLRFFCPAVVQPAANGVVQPDYFLSENTKRGLILVTKVLQNLSNGIMFGAKEGYMGGILNDFISNNMAPLNDFFMSFVSNNSYRPYSVAIQPPSPYEIKVSLANLVENLKFALTLDEELPEKLGSERTEILKQIIPAPSVYTEELIKLICEPDMKVVSAICSTMKPTQIDAIAEGLVTVFSRQSKVNKLLEWVITDEVSGAGFSSKKFDVSTESAAQGPTCIIEGYLTKMGGNFKTWRRRWFVLTEDSLSYFKRKDDQVPIQAIEMRICSKVRAAEQDNLEIGYIFEISTPGRVYHLCANSSDSRQKWIDAISPIIEKGLLGSLMKNRNKKEEPKRSTLFVSQDESANAKQNKTRLTVDPAMMKLAKNGWLVKKGGNFKNWKKRWFSLSKGYLVYYKDDSKNELMGIIDFEDVHRVESAEAKLNLPRCFEVGTSNRTYYMLASSEQEMREWIDILKSLLYYFKPSLALSDPTPSAEKKKGPNKIFLEGWLAKQGGNTKSWKNRWFLLRENTLLYFQNSADSTNDALAKGAIPLEDAQLQIIEHHKFSFCFAIAISNRVYFLLAKDRNDLDKWTSAIIKQIQSVSTGDNQLSKDLSTKMNISLIDKLGSSKPTIRIGASEISDGNTHGYLLKMSKSLNDKSLSFHKWKSRYFVLKNYCLYYFKSPFDEEALGTIELSNTEIEKISDSSEAQSILGKMKGQKYGDIDYTEGITNKTGFVLKGRTKKYFMIAENEQTCQRWLTNIKEAEKAWYNFLQSAGVSEELMKDTSARVLEDYINQNERTRKGTFIGLEELKQNFSPDLKIVLKNASLRKQPSIQFESSDESSGDEE